METGLLRERESERAREKERARGPCLMHTNMTTWKKALFHFCLGFGEDAKLHVLTHTRVVPPVRMVVGPGSRTLRISTTMQVTLS